MLWFILLIIGIIFIAAVVKSGRGRASTAEVTSTSQKRYIERDGKVTEADSVFDAWTSGDLGAMLAQLNQNTSLVDRHFLLMNIVDQTYRCREDKEMRKICHQIAQLHINEFPKIKPDLKKDLGILPRVSTFQQYATLLAEEEQFSEAIAVCETAIKFGLSDGTKTDFQGRIERIKRKKEILKKIIPNKSFENRRAKTARVSTPR